MNIKKLIGVETKWTTKDPETNPVSAGWEKWYCNTPTRCVACAGTKSSGVMFINAYTRDPFCCECHERTQSSFALAAGQPAPDNPPGLRPLTEWNDDLAGKRVVCLNNSCNLQSQKNQIKKGEVYTIERQYASHLVVLVESKRTWRLKRFALAPDQSESVEEPPKQPVIETSHSMQLKFPDGELIDIPAPDGEGWVEDVLWDEWTEPDGKRVTETASTFGAGVSIESFQYLIRTTNSKIVAKEYFRRILFEKPLIVSCSSWTRTVPEPVEPERYEAYSNYPLLLGEE